MNFPRGCGLLIHPTSLPGSFGIGDMGPGAKSFVDFLESTGQTYWQILPLGPTGPGNSPYSTFSAFAGNTLLISPEGLKESGLVCQKDLNDAPAFEDHIIDFGEMYGWKMRLLSIAFEKFRSAPDGEITAALQAFCRQNAWWLDDYAAYRALKTAHDNSAWFEWGEPLRSRRPEALATAHSQLKREIDAERFYQYLFFSQWQQLKHYADERGIRIIGDIPIFVALDSADVWCNQSQFKLADDGSPKVVSGVPPDYFSKTGQLWGNPIYDWDAMLKDDLNWWTARIAFSLFSTDIVRLDHFIGFIRNWEVPGGDLTAENGEWRDVPGPEIFRTLNRRLGRLPLIAEDLGSVTREVEELRDALEMPGMRILQYAFGGDAHSRDLPHNYVRNTVAYTGTHDNDTTVGWYKRASKRERSYCREYLNSNGRGIHRDMLRSVIASVADIAIIPVQDLLGLPSEARMNTPGTNEANWQWRLRIKDLSDEIGVWLAGLTRTYGRWRNYEN